MITITCPRCGMTSAHPKDIEQGYCGNCHDWTGLDGMGNIERYDCPVCHFWKNNAADVGGPCRAIGCDGIVERVEYVPASQLAGAVEALEAANRREEALEQTITELADEIERYREALGWPEPQGGR